MKTLTVYGASDDLIETSGIKGCDEFSVYSDNEHVARLNVKSKEASIVIHCIYAGYWTFAIGTRDGYYDELPNWKIVRTWGDNCHYSETLSIEVPNDAKLTFEKVQK